MDKYLIEHWKLVEFDDKVLDEEYFMVSSHGRLKKLVSADDTDGKLKTPNLIHGYPRVEIRLKSGTRSARYLHKLIAEAFIKKPNDSCVSVVHMDYDKANNHISNLKWVTKAERYAHQQKNPIYENKENRITNCKLNAGRVKIIKKKLMDPNRKTRLKIIAKQFGVTTMQLQRIKTGENWGHVKID